MKSLATAIKKSNMKITELKSLSLDELWQLHEAVAAELTHKMAAERDKLEHRLQKLTSIERQGPGAASKTPRARRPYPKVLPKYRNPKNPQETWAGRGKQPRWVTAQLRTGKKLDDFLIPKKRA
jgi:DNA-binding protein H-NS